MSERTDAEGRVNCVRVDPGKHGRWRVRRPDEPVSPAEQAAKDFARDFARKVDREIMDDIAASEDEATGVGGLPDDFTRGGTYFAPSPVMPRASAFGFKIKDAT